MALESAFRYRHTDTDNVRVTSSVPTTDNERNNEKRTKLGGYVSQPERLMRRLLDVKELAEYIGLSVHTVYTMVSQRRIPFTKVGRLTKFDVRAIDEWLAKHTVSPMKPLLFS